MSYAEDVCKCFMRLKFVFGESSGPDFSREKKFSDTTILGNIWLSPRLKAVDYNAYVSKNNAIFAQYVVLLSRSFEVNLAVNDFNSEQTFLTLCQPFNISCLLMHTIHSHETLLPFFTVAYLWQK